jgi:hypothetical protein
MKRLSEFDSGLGLLPILEVSRIRESVPNDEVFDAILQASTPRQHRFNAGRVWCHYADSRESHPAFGYLAVHGVKPARRHRPGSSAHIGYNDG